MAKTAKSTARQRAEQARRERERLARRSRRIRRAGWAIAAGPAFVILLVIIRIAISAGGGGGGGGDTSALSPATLAALTPSASTLDSVGRGKGVTFPNKITGQPPLTSGDKPLVLYVGGEFCPFCASQRWGLVIALNRFGSFTGLTATRSSSRDVYPNTSTLSFHGASYTSDFLVFNGVETADRDQQPLDSLTPEQQRIFTTYDAPPYADRAGSVPFIDLGNRFLQTGTSIDPQLLAGLSHDQIAAAITDNPTGDLAQAILGSANAFTAIICALTNGQPGNVCGSAAATAYQQEVS